MSTATRAHWRIAAPVAAGVAAAGLVAAGCGSTTPRSAVPARPPASAPLATSLATGQTTWAVVPMGAAAGPNLFWQLFVRPAHAARWSLATPPDVATNGAIALGIQGRQSLIAGIHPSQLLRFSPITSTSDDGLHWAIGAPDPGLASVPDALATSPDATRLIALDRNGSADSGAATPAAGSRAIAGPATWTALVSATTLAATPAARACRPAGLTAAAFTPSGSPVLAATCSRPGIAGIFARQDGTWRAAGPPPSALPTALRQQPVRVLRLVRTGTRLTALLQAGTGQAATLLAAWWNGADGGGSSSAGSAGGAGGARWIVSPPMRLSGLTVSSSSFGSNGAAAVSLAGQHGQYISGPGSAWHQLPAMPPGRTVTLALPADGSIDALATDGSILTAWQLHDGSRWLRTQTSKIPIQYGSSS